MAEAPLIDSALTKAVWPAALAFILALGALPTLVFALLIGFGEVAMFPGLIGWGLCIVVALGFGLLLGRDMAVMTRLLTILRSGADSQPIDKFLLVPGMRALAQQAIALVRAERQTHSTLLERAAADRALLESLPDPLLRLDAAGMVHWRNASADSAFGLETASLLRHPELREAVGEARQTARPIRRSLSLGAPVPRDLDATIIPVAAAQAGGSTYILITDRTRERALEKMRTDFIANSSHELRTPLASLIGFIETLRGPAADDPVAQENFLGIMAEQAQRMQRVIADLLSLSRIEINEHQPPAEMLHLPPLLSRIAAAMEPMLAGTALELDIPADLPRLRADADQLTQVFTNLLDNAIKYGKRGGTIRFTASPAKADVRFDPNGVIIAVADDGAGIARQHIPRLTERFYRVDKGRSRAVGGTGLGLAIVKHIINRHRGRLVIDSVEGQGTIFLVWLPTRTGQ